MIAETEMVKPVKEWSSKFLTALSAMFVLTVLYVLSAGPVVRILRVPGVMPSPAMQTFYAPLTWLCEHSEFVNRAMSWFINHSWPE